MAADNLQEMTEEQCQLVMAILNNVKIVLDHWDM